VGALWQRRDGVPRQAPASCILDTAEHVLREAPMARVPAFRRRLQQRAQAGEAVRAHGTGANQFAERIFQFHFQQARARGDLPEK
jgi:hypothetical protein